MLTKTFKQLRNPQYQQRAHEQNHESARTQTRIIPEICQAPILLRPRTKYPMRGTPRFDQYTTPPAPLGIEMNCAGRMLAMLYVCQFLVCERSAKHTSRTYEHV